MADATPSIMAGIERAMHHLADRQRVIAQNIANSETAGYKAQDLAEPNFADLLAQREPGRARIARPRVALTAGMVALGARPSLATGSVVLDHDVTETKPDGNNVTLEDQLLKMGKVQADFATMASLYRKQQGLLKIALGHGNG